MVYVVAGPEFVDLESHIIIIYKAFYELRNSGLRWHERLADILRSMDFSPSRADTDIWLRKQKNVYKYIADYVFDLAILWLKIPKVLLIY